MCYSIWENELGLPSGKIRKLNYLIWTKFLKTFAKVKLKPSKPLGIMYIGAIGKIPAWQMVQ